MSTPASRRDHCNTVAISLRDPFTPSVGSSVLTSRSLPSPFLAVAGLTACSGGSATTAPVPPTPPVPVDTGPPTIQREMRGLWIATVANIDWPSRSTLTADQQRAELDDILDRAATAGLNAVVLPRAAGGGRRVPIVDRAVGRDAHRDAGTGSGLRSA